MDKDGFINLAQAKEMSESKLQRELGKRSKYLRDTLGMDRFECANFMSSVANLSIALEKIFEKRRSEKKDK